MKRIVLMAFALAMVSQASAAADPEQLGSFGAWKAYTYAENGGKVCFMSSAPEKQESSVKDIKRGEAYLFVTHWAADRTKNVVSVAIGYPFQQNSKPSVAVDGKTFNLFTEGEMAWTRDQQTDDALATALQKGSAVVVKGVSRRGTQTTDTYSLKGSGDAYKAITKECGL